MFGFIKKLFGQAPAQPKAAEAPYKVEAPVAESVQPEAPAAEPAAKAKTPRKPRAAKKSVKK